MPCEAWQYSHAGTRAYFPYPYPVPALRPLLPPRYHGHAVTAPVVVDESGAPSEFSTTDRFDCNPDRSQELIRPL